MSSGGFRVAMLMLVKRDFSWDPCLSFKKHWIWCGDRNLSTNWNTAISPIVTAGAQDWWNCGFSDNNSGGFEPNTALTASREMLLFSATSCVLLPVLLSAAADLIRLKCILQEKKNLTQSEQQSLLSSWQHASLKLIGSCRDGGGKGFLAAPHAWANGAITGCRKQVAIPSPSAFLASMLFSWLFLT